jgi:DNA replication protein DnaD
VILKIVFMETPVKPAEAKAPATKQMRESTKKWGKPAIEAGFSIIPSVLFKHQNDLQLTPVDLNILLQLADFWWKANRRPIPAKGTLAKRLGVDSSTIRRHIANLEERGLIKRVKRWDDAKGQRSNEYDLKGLADALHPFAVRATKEKKAKQQAKKATATTEENNS